MKAPTGRVLGLTAALALNACGPDQPFPARDGLEPGDSGYRRSVDFLEKEIVQPYVEACESDALSVNMGDNADKTRLEVNRWVRRVDLFRGSRDRLFSTDVTLNCAPIKGGAGVPNVTIEICDRLAGGKWVFDGDSGGNGLDLHFEGANRYECPKN